MFSSIPVAIPRGKTGFLVAVELMNIMGLLKKRAGDSADVSHETHPGMADDRFSHADGLITKSEIRSICLSRLNLTR